MLTMMRSLALGAVALMGTMLSAPSSAEDRYIACIGEKPEKCPVRYDAFRRCGYSLDTAAQEICTVTRNGQKEVGPYRTIWQGDHSGGHCGYTWFLVVCLDQ